VAAVILEPTGAHWGLHPLAPSYLHAARRMTDDTGALFIMDEVITGFRMAPGGASERYGVIPDLSTHAKILGGGLPSGCVTGRDEIISLLEIREDDSDWNARQRVAHQGTFNANPVSAAAGIAALEQIEATDACARANATGEKLRERLNEVLEAEDVPWAAYGSFSGLHLFTNPKGRGIRPSDFDPLAVPYAELKTKQRNITHRLRLAMLVQGVDLNNWPGALLSAAHGESELSDTVDAFREAMRMLKREGELDR
jgi:glutamate-1-semialdehyde 2,1-aminomutase